MVVPCMNSIETTHGLTLLTKYDLKEMKKTRIFVANIFISFHSIYYAQHKVMEFNILYLVNYKHIFSLSKNIIHLLHTPGSFKFVYVTKTVRIMILSSCSIIVLT